MTRTALGRRAAIAAAFAAAPARAARAITLVGGAPPGSSADLWLRGFAAFLERHWPHVAVGVASRSGEGGLLAARLVAEADPDARLVAAVATPVLLARAVARGETALFDRLRFVAAVVEEPLLLIGHPGRAGELAALRALPGGTILGAPPAGSAAELAAGALARRLRFDPLAFANAAAARGAVMAGTIPCALLAAPDAWVALRDGRIVALGVAGARRVALLPDVPTLTELGLPVAVAARRGFAVAAATPAAEARALAKALAAAAADPELAAVAAESGYLPDYRGMPDWDTAVRRRLERLRLREDAAALADPE